MKYTPVAPAPAAPAKPKARSGKVVARKSVPPGEVRIIGGIYKRTRVPVMDRPGLRPTPDRVRETLFNWLGQDLSGWRCVDAFAGTGVLGFEAASRGAAQVLLCEQDAALVDKLKALQVRLKATSVTVERGDGVNLLRRQGMGSMQLVFLDPPFESEALYAPALKAAADAIDDDGLVYLEAPRAWPEADLAPMGLVPLKTGKAGAVHFHLLAKMAPQAS
jgi:16S rRNA (guanine966-N2)-methyltransferase